MNMLLKNLIILLEIDTKDDRVLTVKGITLLKLAKHKEAIEVYDKILQINPKNIKAVNVKKFTQQFLKKYYVSKIYSKPTQHKQYSQLGAVRRNCST